MTQNKNFYTSPQSCHADDEHLADFHRQPTRRQPRCEKLMNMARSFPHLGRRSLSHLMCQLRSTNVRRQHKGAKP